MWAGYRAAKGYAFGVPTLWDNGEGNTGGRAVASSRTGLAWSRTRCRHGSFLQGNREISGLAERLGPVHIGKAASGRPHREGRIGTAAKAVADDDRTGDVRSAHRTREAGEQSRATGGGAGGGKGWRKGVEPRETRAGKAGTGPRAGQACHRRWSAYERPQGRMGSFGSPRFSTTSMALCSGGPIAL